MSHLISSQNKSTHHQPQPFYTALHNIMRHLRDFDKKTNIGSLSLEFYLILDMDFFSNKKKHRVGKKVKSVLEKNIFFITSNFQTVEDPQKWSFTGSAAGRVYWMIHWIWWKFGVRMSAATDVLSWVMQSLQFHVFINFSWHLASWPIDACRSHLHQYKYPQLLLIKSCFQRISGNWSGRLSQNNQRKVMGEKKNMGRLLSS